MTVSKSVKILHESFPYNRNMAHALYRSTFLENWGSGIHRIIEACQEQGVEEPTWRWDGAFVYVTFKRPAKQSTNTDQVPNNVAPNSPETEQVHQKSDTVNDTVNGTVNGTAKLILQTISDNPRITYQEIVNSTSIPRATVARHISKLLASGYLIRHGADKNGYWEVVNRN